MDVTGKKVAILVDNYFEQAEFEEPLSALRDAGAQVTIIGASTKELQGLQHVEKGDTFQADLLLRDASPNDYDALVLPGGAINADALRVVETAQDWAREFLDNHKPLAVICHAPWVLVSADALDGRRLTSYHTIQDDIENAGGTWVDQQVVVDDTLITSRQPDDLPAFNDALLTMLMQGTPPAPAGDTEAVAPVSKTANQEVDDETAVEDEARLRSLGYDQDRDELSAADRRDILADQDEDDPDALHPSGTIPRDEQDNTQ